MTNFKEVAIKAVKEAERAILKYYQDDIEFDLKPDKTPVTLADKEAEKVIKNVIKDVFPDHSFLGEEEGVDNNLSEYRWIIDPIDGTKNFMRKINIWGTLLALEKNGEIILGVANAPISKELIIAEKGKGAYKNDKKLKVSNIEKLEDGFISHGNLKFFDEINKIQNLTKLSNLVLSCRGSGNFWPSLLVAEGKIDCSISVNLKYWDMAATKLIIEEAGGIVTDIYGNDLNDKSTTIIATNGKIHSQVLEIFNN